MAGHIFVIRGDVTHLRCDARLVPVYKDHLPGKEKPWIRDAEAALRERALTPPPGWPAAMRAWNLGSADDQSPTLWVTQVGLDPPHRDLAWAMASVREYLDEALAHARTLTKLPSNRSVPLLAMHLVASGEKNAKDDLGDVVKVLLKTVREFVDAHDADVAIVVRDAKEYAALQTARIRDTGYWFALPSSLLPVADALADETRRGGLCVLTGAGLSVNAGLPSWGGLLEALAKADVIEPEERRRILGEPDLLRRATTLAERYQASGLDFNREIAARCVAPRIALGHGFLANLPVTEYVTLNYDTLLEEAARDAGRELDVLPHGRKGTGRDWLLKLHGCRTRPDEIVITEDDFDTFDQRREAFAAIVESLLVTRHMLVVGFGLTDPNVTRLLRAVERGLRGDVAMRDLKIGTVLALDEPTPDSRRWERRFSVTAVRAVNGVGDDVPARARVLEILLDRLAARATDEFAHILDPRFNALLTDEERAVRGLATAFAGKLVAMAPAPEVAAQVLQRLHDLGLPVDETRLSPYEAAKSSRGPLRRDSTIPIVAVADLHGHLAAFEQLIAYWDREFRGHYRLVLLGDYVDNGPETPALLDRLIALERERRDRVTAILGNHDLACLRSMGWDGGPPDEAWYAQWKQRYWNHGGSTAMAYGADSGAGLAVKMPPAHRAFLQARPWCAELDGFVFVHAGFHPGPLEPQIQALSRRPLLDGLKTVDPLRNKALACIEDRAWTRTVVSGHTKYPVGRAKGAAASAHPKSWPHFVAPRRITLSASVDEDGQLWSVCLSERRFERFTAHSHTGTST